MDKSILLIEDDIHLQAELKEYLLIYFRSVLCASDGKEGYKLYEEHAPDAIFSDINLPYLSGLELIEKIRQTDMQTPIVILSAFASNEYLLKAIELHLVTYLIKPISTQKLQAAIEKVLFEIDTTQIQLSQGFSWDPQNYALFYKQKQIKISKNEATLIKILVANRSQFIMPQELYYDIFFHDEPTNTNAIVQLLSRFKKRVFKQIGTDDFFIENLYGCGYKIKAHKSKM